MKRFKKIQKFKGFTLIELMVSTSIFVIIMLAAMGALFVLIDGARNARALRISMDNVNFAMESMTRSIKMGQKYNCGDVSYVLFEMTNPTIVNDCDNEGNTAISFVPQGITFLERLGYILVNREDGSTKTLQRCQGFSCVDIVSENIDVKKLKFYSRGSNDPNKHPGVYIIMEGTFKIKSEEIGFSIQTMTSMRNFDKNND